MLESAHRHLSPALAWALCLVGLLPACDGPAAERAATSLTAPTLGSAAAARDRAPAATRRGTVRGGERVERVVTWPSGDPDRDTRLSLGPDDIDTVDRASVPVLAPPGEWTGDLHVIPLDSGFALVARRGPTKLVVQASRIAHLHPGLPPARPNTRVRGVDGNVTENEGIRSATWIEHGVAYTADLECADPEAPACSDEGLVALVDALVYIGGARPATVGGAP